VGVTLGGSSEPFFGRPLWLQTPCCGHGLWAYNSRHLDVLEDFVSARLRERTGESPTMAMIPRLPAWMKKAQHRAEVTAAVGRLRGQVKRTAVRERSPLAVEQAGKPGARPYRGLYFNRQY
jgi:hypothetical protein